MRIFKKEVGIISPNTRNFETELEAIDEKYSEEKAKLDSEKHLTHLNRISGP